jgi:hypothetical protein
MLPSIPGSLIFIREVAAANARIARAKDTCRVWLIRLAYAVAAIAATAISAMNVLVNRVFGFMIVSFLSV